MRRRLPRLPACWAAVIVAAGCVGSGLAWGREAQPTTAPLPPPRPTSLPKPAPAPPAAPVAAEPSVAAEGGRVWAGTDRGLFISRDTGKSWRDLGQARLGNVQGIATTPEVMVLGTKAGIWRAQKGGDWMAPEGELSGQFIRAVATDGEKFYAGTDRGEVFVSEDKALSWQKVSEGLPEKGQIFELKTNLKGELFAGLYSKGFYVLRDGAWQNLGAKFGFSILPVDENVLVVGGNPGGITRSEDGGKTWSDVRGHPPNAPSWMLFQHKQNLFYGTTGKSGLYRSEDLGKNWAPVGEKEFGNRAVVAMTAAGEVLITATVNGMKPEWFDPGRVAGILE